MRESLRRVIAPYANLPTAVWLMAFGRLVNGGARRMTLPFLSLYLAEVLHAQTGQIGVVLALEPLLGIFGQGIGGAVTDRFGRRPVLLASLASEAVMLFAMAWVNTIVAFAVLNGLLGLLSAAFWPTSQAVVADETPPGQRVRSFAFLYFMNNIGTAIGPAVGAGLAITGHSLVFSLSAAVLLSWTAVLFFRLPDTAAPAEARRPFGSGYGRALRDRRLLFYILASFLATFAYNQMDISLPLYLVRMHIPSPSAVYAIFMSSNAVIVVASSLLIANLAEGKRPTRVLAAGACLYVLSLLGFALVRGTLPLLLIVIPFTVGEMLGATVAGAYLAGIAPAEDRGVYMGVSSLSWVLASAAAPLASGFLLNVLAPETVLLLVAVPPAAAALIYALSSEAPRMGKAKLQAG